MKQYFKLGIKRLLYWRQGLDSSFPTPRLFRSCGIEMEKAGMEMTGKLGELGRRAGH